MPEYADEGSAVEQFLQDYVETIPHLETLLLLWRSRPQTWSIEDVSKNIFLTAEAVSKILDGLVRQELIVAGSVGVPKYFYQPLPDRDRIVGAVDSAYRSELVRVSKLIHSKALVAARDPRPVRLEEDND